MKQQRARRKAHMLFLMLNRLLDKRDKFETRVFNPADFLFTKTKLVNSAMMSSRDRKCTRSSPININASDWFIDVVQLVMSLAIG